MSNIIPFIANLDNSQESSGTFIPASAPQEVHIPTDYRQEWFTVDKLPLHSSHGTVSNKRGIFVGGNCINVVSPNYEVHQPIDIMKKFKEVADQTNLDIKRVLTNPNNGGLLISAKFYDTKILGEEHDVNLTFYTSHCGKYKTFLTLDLLRMACFNQTPALYRNKDRHIFAEKHYRNALDVEKLETYLVDIPSSVIAYNEKAERLQQKGMTFKSFQDWYIDYYKISEESKQFDSKVEKLKSIYFNATGQKGLAENAYKAYNAVTFINTHEGKNTQYKNERVYIQGSQDSLKALDSLLAA